MKLLMVTTLLSRHGSSGGVGVVALAQLEALKLRDLQVQGCALRYRGDEEYRGWVTFPVSKRRSGGQKFLFSLSAAVWLIREIRRADVVHLHLCRDFITCFSGLLVAIYRKPLVTQSHGMLGGVGRGRLVRGFDLLCIRPLLNRAAVRLTLTQLEAEGLACIMGKTDVPVQMIFNCPPEPGTAWTPSWPPMILYVGRLHVRKGLRTLYDACKRLQQDGLDMRLTIVGPDDGFGSELRALTRDDEWCAVEEPIDQTAALTLMTQATAFVLVSRAEPFPMAVLEAMACGTPCIISDEVGFADSAQEAGAALVISADDVSGLTSALAKLMTEPLASALYSVAGQHFVRSCFSSSRLSDVLLQTYTASVKDAM